MDDPFQYVSFSSLAQYSECFSTPRQYRPIMGYYFLFRSVTAAKPVSKASSSQMFWSGNSGVVAEKVIVTVSDACAVSRLAEEGKVRITVP